MDTKVEEAPQKNEEEIVEADLTEYEGHCTLCNIVALRECILCHVGICDTCSLGKVHCKMCIIEGAEDLKMP